MSENVPMGGVSRPEPPYYLVHFTAKLSGRDPDGYAAVSERMVELGFSQPGFLGAEASATEDGREVTILYYRDDAAIRAWKANPEHLEAQRLGRERWYDSYVIEIARVERAYGSERDADGA